MLKIHQKGFTLIEILFVIAILSVLASLGISVLQQRAQQLKVEKTALQMQQILQAGMSYKSDKKVWPKCDGSSEGFDEYLPVNSSGNPWGYTYACEQPKDMQVFRVKVQVPGSAANAKIADQIIALLPNAEKDVTTDITKVYVYTDVSGTGGGSVTEDIVFKKVGAITINNADFIQETGDTAGTYTTPSAQPVTFYCPYNSNMQGQLLLMPTNIEPGDSIVDNVDARIIKKLSYDFNCDTTPATGFVSCRISVTFQTLYQTEGDARKEINPATAVYNPEGRPYFNNPGSLSLSYFAYCKKP